MEQTQYLIPCAGRQIQDPLSFTIRKKNGKLSSPKRIDTTGQDAVQNIIPICHTVKHLPAVFS
jgi:hypothetical protein